MPAKWFICPDGEQIEIDKCLSNGGCRMDDRCATRPFLRLIGYDREWKGVSPSSAGNGPRALYLKAITDYAIDPNDRVFAAIGTGTHAKLSIHDFDVFAEEKLSDKQMEGIADVLDRSEKFPGTYRLEDYKTWGSYKVAKALGLSIEKTTIPILDDNGEPVLLKSGKNAGQPKTRQESKFVYSESDLENEELQLNRYRIFYEAAGFPISEMMIQAIPRDGGTYIAQSRGITRNLYIIPIKRLPDAEVLAFYDNLQAEVDEAFRVGYIRRCNAHENWDGRRCAKYCEVFEPCKLMDDNKGEK